MLFFKSRTHGAKDKVKRHLKKLHHHVQAYIHHDEIAENLMDGRNYEDMTPEEQHLYDVHKNAAYSHKTEAKTHSATVGDLGNATDDYHTVFSGLKNQIKKAHDGIVVGPHGGRRYRSKKSGKICYEKKKEYDGPHKELVGEANYHHARLGMMCDGKTIHERGNIMSMLGGFAELIASEKFSPEEKAKLAERLSEAVKRAKLIKSIRLVIKRKRLC